VIVWLLFSVICVYNTVDILQTYIILQNGLATEWNPIVLFFMNKFGMLTGMIVIKSFWLLILFFLLLYIKRVNKLCELP
jgi:hypothetical protein